MDGLLDDQQKRDCLSPDQTTPFEARDEYNSRRWSLPRSGSVIAESQRRQTSVAGRERTHRETIYSYTRNAACTDSAKEKNTTTCSLGTSCGSTSADVEKCENTSRQTESSSELRSTALRRDRSLATEDRLNDTTSCCNRLERHKGEPRRTECGYGAREKPKPLTSGNQIPWKSRSPSREIKDEKAAADEKKRQEEDIAKLDSKVESQFERLMSAIQGVKSEVHTGFEGMQERMDRLERSVEAGYDSGWNGLKDHMEEVANSICKADRQISLQRQPLAASCSFHPLHEATDSAREEIRKLAGFLIVEKDAELMSAKSFQAGKVMLLKMMESCMSNPTFEQVWHMKYGLDHCVGSILFKGFQILTRTQVFVNGSEGDQEDAKFKRFCRQRMQALEALADWEAEKWSVHLQSQFLCASKCMWHLQTLMIASVPATSVEILNPEAGSKFEDSTMDPLDCAADNFHAFEPVVQFTIFPGFKIEGSPSIKAQVYLQPKTVSACLSGCSSS